MKTLIAAILAATSLITPVFAESGLKFQGTISFNQAVIACVGAPLQTYRMLPYEKPDCERLAANREWAVWFSGKPQRGYEEICLTSMLITQTPTARTCLWIFVTQSEIASRTAP